MLYEVALIKKPTQKEIEEGKMETLVLKPTPVIAKDEKSAAVLAVMEHKEQINGDLGQVEVLVRPFAK